MNLYIIFLFKDYVHHVQKNFILVISKTQNFGSFLFHIGKFFNFRVKEVVPKQNESDTEVTEIPESSSSVQKKSRLDDDDDTTTILDDGQIWSKPSGETRETTR